MADCTEQSGSDGSQVLDHVTDYRLTRQPHFYPEGQKKTWWSVLIELEGVSINEFAEAVSLYAEDLLIPVVYDAADRKVERPRQPVAIFARSPLISVLNQKDNPFHVASIHLGAAIPEKYLDGGAVSPETREIVVPDGTVVQAMVDDSIAIGHDLFRTEESKSRVEHAWLMGTLPTKQASHSSLGRILAREETDHLLKSSIFGGYLDEDLFYRKSGQVDPGKQVISNVALRRSHGTHVGALAAGYAMTDQCHTRPIICVALPIFVVEDTTGSDSLPLLYMAFHDLVKQARRFRTKSGSLAPVVISFSYGNTAGPHDGTGQFALLFEYYLGEAAHGCGRERQKIWLTLPAGNSNLLRMHAVDTGEKPRKDTRLDLTVLPDDRTVSQVQIWLPNSLPDHQPDFARISVTPPFGGRKISIRTQPGQQASLFNSVGQEIARLAYQFEGGLTSRGLVTLSLNPTGSLVADCALASAGIWKIRIRRNKDAPAEPFHIWVRRDETLPGFQTGARQAFFSNPDYRRFDCFGAPLPVDPPDSDCPVRRAGTLSGFACGVSPVVVGAYTLKNAEMSPYSSAGPIPENWFEGFADRVGPDVSAEGDTSVVLRGVYSAGSRCGSWVRMSGTSVASPRLAWLAADAIGEYGGSARSWSHFIAAQRSFPFRENPGETRTGAGGVKIDRFGWD
ncbi:S8 family serine peptidase [Labrenzia sp. OB1]|uniref:S8 family serine peptidase n=1 Tax=Labrenzia sp. OB1 TaxID=1561204 RepID=UPI0007B2FE60|nr:S8 family serine peptidase [Labrenzia sp. OB1]KZM47425.1 hypothetical protein OA90_26055 [Labrenzia sp. OB1]